MLTFTIDGEPQGKGRPRFSTHNGRVMTHTPERTALYENLVRMEYKRQCGDFRFGDGEGVIMEITAYYGIPKSAGKGRREAMINGEIRPIKKPDGDNVLKVVADSLNGHAYRDDAQVVKATVEKFYSLKARVEVTLIGFSEEVITYTDRYGNEVK